MSHYVLYNDDQAVARFDYAQGMIKAYEPVHGDLLPMQIRAASADGFTSWIRERAIDLNTVQHRNLVADMLGSRDKVHLALMTHMFSISDTFTCFEEGEFTPRRLLCNPKEHEAVSDYVLLTSDTSLRNAALITPNVSTDGSFTKTWKYEDGEWWLYKLQSAEATRSEVEISKVLRACGWDAAEYRYIGSYRKRIKSRNFLGEHEFFEPYDSFRYAFSDISEDEDIVMSNISALGEACRTAWKRILLADALFLNGDRHMRNFGVIRSTKTGEVLRLAPNFDNNQAYRGNPGGHYSAAMLRLYWKTADDEDQGNLRQLLGACEKNKYLAEAWHAGIEIIHAAPDLKSL